MAPVAPPEPPEVVNVIGVPTVPVKVVLAMLSVAWAKPAKEKLLVADVAASQPALVAFVAVTTQVVAAVALIVEAEIEHPVPVTA